MYSSSARRASMWYKLDEKKNKQTNKQTNRETITTKKNNNKKKEMKQINATYVIRPLK